MFVEGHIETNLLQKLFVTVFFFRPVGFDTAFGLLNHRNALLDQRLIFLLPFHESFFKQYYKAI